ncbi:hypothetical protein DPV78_001639 [Talaromyces pinophilus]|nr:hypothetical protein DPV78_001639 [Talaromyces pinophilus]
MVRLTKARARRIIDEIRVNNRGGGGPFQYSLYENARQLGASTRAIAQELYTSESRFVYELIQNAEDNSYNCAQNDDPFISFTLTPDEIIVENNETGFTREDVCSICKVGDSTKSNRIGAIGENGVGFKYVFQVARKVRIQSGIFDFYFEHLPSDTGMGMVTPFNEKDGPGFRDGTRMTLTLLHPNDFSERSKDLLRIPNVLILFLPKLKRIEVSVRDSNNGTSSSIIHESHDGEEEKGSTMRVLTRTDDEIFQKYFHVERRTFQDLPKDDILRNRDSAEVVLAFPITSDSRPILEPQLTFSFRPMGSFGFKFIIQSDFVTTANRQDVHLCSWNYVLLQHISKVFLDAVDKFCKIPVLQYEWLYFLPATEIDHEYWSELHDLINELLAKRPILLTENGAQKRPRQLQQIPEIFRDKHGMPLFEDLEQEVYLSSKYHAVHTEYLRALGVTDLTWSNILARITPYLQGENPRFLRLDHDEDWHTRVANVLMRGLESPVPGIRTKIRQLPLIPLRCGSLASNWAEHVYFPTDTLGNEIPVDSGLRIVDGNAVKNNARKMLYEKLGVQYYEPSLIISHIYKRYDSPLDIGLSDSVSHLKYLYQTLPDDQALDERIFVMNQNQVPIYRKPVTLAKSMIVDDLYFGTPEDFGTEHLAEELNIDGQPGIHIVHEAYLEAVSLREFQARPWKQWLEKKALIHSLPRLLRSSTKRISPLFTKIIKYRPHLLVGVLKRYWNSYKSHLQESKAIREAIRDAKVPCYGNSIRRPLETTYLATPQLREICRQACVDEYFDLFLDLVKSSEVSENGLVEWEFLTVLGVGIAPDINFFRNVLSHLIRRDSGQDLERGLFYIYEQLSEEAHYEHGDKMSEILDDLSAVCIPTESIQTTALSRCVWDGLPCLQVKNCLSQYPEYTSNTRVSYLFREILALRDADWETYLDELIYLQEHKSADQLFFEDLHAIYSELQVVTQDENNWETVLTEFEEHRLIYVPAEKAWVSPSSCIWAEAPRIDGIYGIGDVYSDLAGLFMERLFVKAPTIATYTEELRLLVGEPFPRNIPSIKGAIDCISNLNPIVGDLDELMSLSCLPVLLPGSMNTVKLMRPSEIFFIADRREYEQLFRGKVPVLDFSLEEIHALHPFLEALGLTDRYMSVTVQETARVQQSSEVPSESLTQAFQARAKALYRCALHFRSTKTQIDNQEIYNKLRHALVYECDGITKHLQLCYGNQKRTVKVISDRGTFHLEDKDDDTLRLFGPRDAAQQEKCSMTQLPKVLGRYLLIDDNNPHASKILLLVLHASIGILDEILDDEGIVRVPESE